MRRRFLPLTTTLVALALLAAGCSDDSTEAPNPVDSTTTTATAEEASSTTTVAPETTTTVAPRPSFVTPEATTIDGVLGLGRPAVIAHAGGDQSWPHSTMYAFNEAAAAGVDVLEMDVQLTADGVLVVQHDDTVAKTTAATDRVRDLTYDEIQALDNGYWWSAEWPSHDLPADAYVYRGIRTGDVEPPAGYTPDDFRVETFRAIAEAFPDHVLDIEIKIPKGDDGGPDPAFAIEGARVLAEEIDDLDRGDSVVVVSFDDDVIAAFHELAPEIATSPGTGALTDWFLAGTELLSSHRILQVPPNSNGLDVLRLDGFLEKAAAENRAIWVWPDDADTQENPDFYEALLEFDIDGLLAGHPELAIERYRELGVIP